MKIIINAPEEILDNTLTKDDVWQNMVVAKSYDDCPIFKDKVPYKSITVVCEGHQRDNVIYWLEYVHGCNSVSKIKKLENNKLGIRSDYQCW